MRDVSFEARAGEVLGIGGLLGAGRSELLLHLAGIWGERTQGSVLLDGKPLAPGRPWETIRRGLVMVTEDRRRWGLFGEHGVGFNLSLSSLKGLLIDEDREFAANREMAGALRVKAPGLDAPVGGLSGGNQQKVVIGRALMTEPSVVLLDEPTRGIDVGAKLEVYEIVNRLTDAGKAVILVSSELPELLGMSDRVLMLHEGSVGGVFGRGAGQEQLMAAAMGDSRV